MDATGYEEIAGRLRGLLIRLDDRVGRRDQAIVAEYIDANELGLALDQLAYALSEDGRGLVVDERSDMLALAEAMGIESRISSALRSCPPR